MQGGHLHNLLRMEFSRGKKGKNSFGLYLIKAFFCSLNDSLNNQQDIFNVIAVESEICVCSYVL